MCEKVSSLDLRTTWTLSSYRLCSDLNVFYQMGLYKMDPKLSFYFCPNQRICSNNLTNSEMSLVSCKSSDNKAEFHEDNGG